MDVWMHLCCGSGSEDSCSREWTTGTAKDSRVFFQACVHHQCRTRSEYSGGFATYSCTEGQITSTLRLFSRAHRSAVSAKEDARPRPRNLLGTSVWINSSTFPVIYIQGRLLVPHARSRSGQWLPSAVFAAYGQQFPCDHLIVLSR